MSWRLIVCTLLGALLLSGTSSAFELFSNDFTEGGMIAARHTCDGTDLSPHLAWKNPPPQTKSFALICHDPDAPSGNFVHWVVYDIPAGVSVIPSGGQLPAGARQLANDFGRMGYGGPCPPSGTHRYFFTLYALSVEKLDAVTRQTIEQKIRRHQIGTAILMGRYARRK